MYRLSYIILLVCLSHTNGDTSVLLDFKRSIKIDPNGVLDSWSDGIPLCNWSGVTCHPQHTDRIRALDLHNQSLVGTLTPSLGRLELLDYLDLGFNNFTGRIPGEIGNCTFLTVLKLGPNEFTGKIPDMFGRLEQLSILEIWATLLDGSVPPSIGNCSRLKQLDLCQNFLTGEFTFSSLPMIQYFSLWGNDLQGRIPQWVSNCTKLERLLLDTNNFTGPLPDGLGHAQTKLWDVRLFGNWLSGAVPLSLTNCSSLRNLLLSQNLLTGSVPTEIGYLHQLQQLTLWSNSLTSTIPNSIGNLSSVVLLSLAFNDLTGSIPLSLGLLNNLQVLNLGYNFITGTIPSALEGCKKLEVLSLGRNRLSGQIPAVLGQLQKISVLHLHQNYLTGEIPGSIGELSNLGTLHLSHNFLNGSLPDSLANLRSTLAIAFDVSFNKLEGVIPPWIGGFDKVQTISLGSNNFSAQIPATIKNCKGLLWLGLSSNSLTGEVPAGIGELWSLQHLDLSVNHLSGPIPNLTALTSLEFLNLSKNNLQGQIPTSEPFSKFNISSFLENPLLCGATVDRTCNTTMNSRTKDTNSKELLKWLVPLVIISVLLSAFVAALVLYRMIWIKKTTTSSFQTKLFTVHLDETTLEAFTVEQLADITNNFADDNVVGEGGYSRVFKGVWEGKPVAVKLMKHQDGMLIEMQKSFLAEATTLAKLRHRNIVKVFGYCCCDHVLALVMEYMANGSLAGHLVENPLDSDSKLSIALDVAQAMHYIHHDFDNPIIHCDLKPQNVLLDDDFTARITDFGISKLVIGNDRTVTVSNFRGTIGFAPPEYAQCATVSTSGDIYAYGMLLLVMITGRFPTDKVFHESGIDLRGWVLQNILNNNSKVGEPNIERSLTQVGLLCTADNPFSRPTIKEVLAMLLEIRPAPVKPIPSLQDLVLEETALINLGGRLLLK